MSNFHPNFKESVLRQIIKELYLPTYESSAKLSRQLFTQNMALYQKDIHDYVMHYYDGEYYSLGGKIPGVIPTRIDLHKSLQNQMDKTTLAKKTAEAEELVISAYLRRILNNAHTLKDIYNALPEILRHVLPRLPHQDHEHNQVTFTPAVAQMFVTDNIKCEQLIKERLLINLLLKS